MTSIIAEDRLPTRADLDAATARTAAVLADPASTRAERVLAAETRGGGARTLPAPPRR